MQDRDVPASEAAQKAEDQGPERTGRCLVASSFLWPAEITIVISTNQKNEAARPWIGRRSYSRLRPPIEPGRHRRDALLCHVYVSLVQLYADEVPPELFGDQANGSRAKEGVQDNGRPGFWW